MRFNEVERPTHEVAAVYSQSLSEHRLSFADFNHRVKELSLRGSYRPLLRFPLDMSWRACRYSDPTAPLAQTDLAALRGEPPPCADPDGPRWLATCAA